MYTCVRRCSVGCGQIILVAAALTHCLSSAFAAEQPVIVTTGEALLFASPAQVEFAFVRHFVGDTLEQSIAQCDAFLKAAPQAVRGSELQPVEVRTAPPLIMALASRQTQASVRVRFSMAVFNTAKTGSVQFAALCDKMTAIADAMKCTLSHPELIPADKEGVEASAVSRAAENAYPAAEAVASAVKSLIFAVEKVEVLEIIWEQQPDRQTAEVQQMACRAKVRVTYALGPQ